MTRRTNWRVVYAAVALAAISLQAQAPAATSTLGVVSKVDAAGKQIVLKTEAGADVVVNLQPAATFRRVAPGETDLRKAETIAITDINPGDRVLARGKASDDQKSVAATLIVVMSQGDIAKKQAAERADWDKNGVIGTVTAVNGQDVAISVRGPGGVKTVTITPGPDAVIRRYAPESIKFDDARMSTLAEIKTGDQVRARGEKSSDGSKLTAAEIVSGSFREIAATIISIDAAENRMRVTDLATKKPVTIKLNADSSLKKLPAQMAQMLAARNRPPEAGAAGRGGATPTPPGAAEGRGGRGGGGDLTQMLNRLPPVTLADLKAGDAIIVLSTVGNTPDQLNVITMLAGVEPILTKPGTREMELGAWSLGGGLGAEP